MPGWVDLADRWHLDLAVAGVVAGVGAASAAALARRPGWARTLATTVAVWVLWSRSLIDGGDLVAVVVALLAATVLPARSGLGRVVMGAVVVAAVAWGAAGDAGLGAVAVAVVASAALVLAAPHLVGRLPAWSAEALALVAAGAIWLSAPDTEAVVITTGALVAASVAARRAGLGRRRAGRPPDGRAGAGLSASTTTIFVALVWSALHGFRGRPAGLLVLAVILPAVLGWVVVDRLEVRRRGATGSGPTLPDGLAGAGVVLAAVTSTVAARTVGRAQAVGAALPVTLGLAALGLAGWLVVTHGERRRRAVTVTGGASGPGSSRRPDPP